MSIFMSMWVVYENPKDLKVPYALRRHDIVRGSNVPKPDNVVYTGHSVQEVVAFAPPGLHIVGPWEGDDPVIACVLA